MPRPRGLPPFHGGQLRVTVRVRGGRPGEQPVLGPQMLERRDGAETGHGEAAVRADQVCGHAHMSGARHRVVAGHAGKVDARELADRTAPAVRADQELRLDRLPPAQLDRHRLLALRQPDDLVPAPDVDTQLRRALGEHPLDPELRHQQRVQRVVRQIAQVERERAEWETGRRFGRGAGRGQPLIQPAPVEHADDLAHQAVRALRVGWFGEAFQDDRAHTGQGEFAGEHQAVGPRACDDDLDHESPFGIGELGVTGWTAWTAPPRTGRGRP